MSTLSGESNPPTIMDLSPGPRSELMYSMLLLHNQRKLVELGVPPAAVYKIMKQGKHLSQCAKRRRGCSGSQHRARCVQGGLLCMQSDFMTQRLTTGLEEDPIKPCGSDTFCHLAPPWGYWTSLRIVSAHGLPSFDSLW